MSGANRYQGSYFDGKTPKRETVTITVNDEGIRIHFSDARALNWKFGEFEQTHGSFDGEEIRLERALEAVTTRDRRLLEAIKAHAPSRLSKLLPDLAGERLSRALGVAFAGVALTVWFVYSFIVPAFGRTVATLIPVAWEEHLGRQLAAEMVPRELRSRDAHRIAALTAIMARLQEGLATRTPYHYEVTLSKSSVFNAYALPGGQVIVNQGLLEQMETPEELAGVLAHEIQHVEHRHVTRNVCEEATTGLLMAGLTGSSDGFGPVVHLAHQLGALKMSRTAEDEADRTGLDLMVAAHLNPNAMIHAFQRLPPSGPAFLQFLSTHPDTQARIATLRKRMRQFRVETRPIKLDVAWSQVRKGEKVNAVE